MDGETQSHVKQVERRATTPVAGAIAGIAFAVLFGVSVTILTTTMADVAEDSGAWLEGGARSIKFALALVPFAGLFFLWFIAVARERLGRFEDQFFSTVFIGSGLLFLAMVFAAAASAGAMVASFARDPSGFADSSTYTYARQMIAQIFSVYALRMAAIFQISQATLWLRTGVMPRWMALLTYPVALVLLFTFTQAQWVILVFPGWVLLVSVYILVVNVRRRPDVASIEPVSRAGVLPASTDGPGAK
ncbi:MAG TPA: hypothetical protein VLA35_06715 [Thermoleophilia bacterium]|nr:hypothetical protein [Thermoleophilia bacterium]